MDAAERRSLFEAIRATPPALTIDAWLSQVARATADSKPHDVVRMLATLYQLRQQNAPKPMPDFVAELRRAAEETGDEGLASRSKWEALQPDLIAMLSQDDTLGITSKALDVMTEVERMYLSARIVSDLRSLFGGSSVGPPVAAVVVHNLIVNYYQDSSPRSVTFGLDARDLEQLRAAVERAVEKDREIRALARKAGLNLLDTESVSDDG